MQSIRPAITMFSRIFFSLDVVELKDPFVRIKTPIPVIDDHPYKSNGDSSVEIPSKKHRAIKRTGSARISKNTKSSWKRKPRRSKEKKSN